MKAYKLFFGLLAGIMLLLCGCTDSSKISTNPRRLVVSVEPMRYFVMQVAGDKFDVDCMTPKGYTPETYEPTPMQMMKMAESRAYLRVGPLSFEERWMAAFQNSAPKMEVFNLSEGITLREEHGGIDPHVWTSPKNALIIGRNIYRALCQLNPEDSVYFRQRLQAFEQKVHQTDDSIRTLLADVTPGTFLIYHPVLGYFARDYGWQQIAMEEDGKMPTPAHVQNLIEICREKNVKTLFVQIEFGTNGCRAIAKETGVRLVPINPLGYRWDDTMIDIAKGLLPEKKE